jgi:membrane protein required for colicin V production
MHWFDVGAGVVLIVGMIWSFFRGLTREVISILGLTAACILSAWGYVRVATALQPVIALVWVRQAIGFVSIFLVTVVCYALLAMIVRRLVKAAGLSLPDRILGGLFGLVKVGVLISILMIVLTTFFPDIATHIAKESQLAPLFFHTAHLLTALLPEEIQDDFQRFYQRAQEHLKQWLPMQPQRRPHTPSHPAATSRATPLHQAAPDIQTSEEQALRRLIRERWQDH